MGGRGSSSGGGGGGGIPPAYGGGGRFGGFKTFGELVGAMNQANITPTPAQNSADKWTDNGNQKLIDYQNLPEDDMGHFLHQVDGAALPQDKWSFYDNPSQKLVSELGLNGKPTVLSKKDFDNYVASTGQQVIYRGWENGVDSRDRFMNSDYSHIGTGRYGDGYYFGSQQTASGYGSVKTQAALGPKTRMIDVNTLRREMAKMPRSAQRAMKIAGTTGSRTYYNDVGGEMQMALRLGYNCIDAGWCKVILDRSILIVRKP